MRSSAAAFCLRIEVAQEERDPEVQGPTCVLLLNLFVRFLIHRCDRMLRKHF